MQVFVYLDWLSLLYFLNGDMRQGVIFVLQIPTDASPLTAPALLALVHQNSSWSFLCAFHDSIKLSEFLQVPPLYFLALPTMTHSPILAASPKLVTLFI